MASKLIRSWAVAASLSALVGGCASTTTRPGGKPSLTDSITNSVKSGANKVTAALTPKPTPPEETGGFREPKPTPSLHVAIAQMAERQGKPEEADKQYHKALDLDSNYLPAMLGIAHLEDSRKNFDVAEKLYQRAAKKHPKDATAHNDLGLCYHRQGKLKDATKSLQTAVELQSARPLYRDNLAAVLVEQGQLDEALKQLCIAHGDAVGHYNLAYLLAQTPNPRASLPYFHKALEKDPTLAPAREWIAQLSAPSGPTGMMPPSPQGGMPPSQQPVMMARQGQPQQPPMNQAPMNQAPRYQAPTQQMPPPPAYQPMPPQALVQQPPLGSAPQAPPPVVISRQPPPAAQAAVPPSELLPPLVAGAAPAAETTAVEPAVDSNVAPREPVIVAQAEPRPREPAPNVTTMRPDGVIRATVGADAPPADTSGDFQFVPAGR